jgi:hypothetical protein
VVFVQVVLTVVVTPVIGVLIAPRPSTAWTDHVYTPPHDADMIGTLIEQATPAVQDWTEVAGAHPASGSLVRVHVYVSVPPFTSVAVALSRTSPLVHLVVEQIHCACALSVRCRSTGFVSVALAVVSEGAELVTATLRQLEPSTSADVKPKTSVISTQVRSV